MQILTGVLLSTLPALSLSSPMKERTPTYAPAATVAASSTSHTSTPSIDLLSHTIPIDGLRGELKARAPSPQQTCANSGTGNSGCANSGINNSGTSNSGISNCGTGLSGVGDGCGASSGAVFVVSQTAAVGAGAYTATLTGPTSTVTVVLDAQHRRSDCAYWEAQGYRCSGAARVRAGLGGALVAAVAGGGWVLVI